MMNFLTPEICIPLFAIGISVYNLIYTRKVDRERLTFEKKYYELNALQLEKERSASFNVSQYAEGNSNRLVIKNTGKAEARNRTIDIPNPEGLSIPDGLSSIFPLERLSPGEFVELLIVLEYKGARKCEIFLNWSDDSGSNRSAKHNLTW